MESEDTFLHKTDGTTYTQTNKQMNTGTTQTYTEWKNNLSNKADTSQTAPAFFGVPFPNSEEIYDEDVVKDVKNFMLAPCCMHQGKMYAAFVQKFKDLSEIKEFFKMNTNILLYKIMVTGNIYSIRYAQLPEETE
jgi:hypothetical protein